jgi:hypothetical protein
MINPLTSDIDNTNILYKIIAFRKGVRNMGLAERDYMTGSGYGKKTRAPKKGVLSKISRKIKNLFKKT